MKIALDVHYCADRARIACVGFETWNAAEPAWELVFWADYSPANYEPGQFFKRELPYLQEAIRRVTRRDEAAASRSLKASDRVGQSVDVVVVDGYVWLPESAPGLGAYLYRALNAAAPVIGVAKNPFRGSPHAVELRRGKSERPLFVTSAGIDPQVAADCIRDMHGPYRIPTLLKRTDQLTRTSAPDGEK